MGWLVQRKLLAVARASVTATPSYTVQTPWNPAQNPNASRQISDWRVRQPRLLPAVLLLVQLSLKRLLPVRHVCLVSRRIDKRILAAVL